MDLSGKTIEALMSDAISGNTLITGVTVDRLGYGDLNFVMHTGVLTTAGASYAVTMEDGNAANMSDAALVDTPQKGLVGTAPTFAGTDGNKTFRVGYSGSKRYVRLKIQPTGSTGAATMSAIALLGRPLFASGSILP